jgi:hypothetical protein
MRCTLTILCFLTWITLYDSEVSNNLILAVPITVCSCTLNRQVVRNEDNGAVCFNLWPINYSCVCLEVFKSKFQPPPFKTHTNTREMASERSPCLQPAHTIPHPTQSEISVAAYKTKWRHNKVTLNRVVLILHPAWQFRKSQIGPIFRDQYTVKQCYQFLLSLLDRGNFICNTIHV